MATLGNGNISMVCELILSSPLYSGHDQVKGFVKRRLNNPKG